MLKAWSSADIFQKYNTTNIPYFHKTINIEEHTHRIVTLEGFILQSSKHQVCFVLGSNLTNLWTVEVTDSQFYDHISLAGLRVLITGQLSIKKQSGYDLIDASVTHYNFRLTVGNFLYETPYSASIYAIPKRLLSQINKKTDNFKGIQIEEWVLNFEYFS